LLAFPLRMVRGWNLGGAGRHPVRNPRSVGRNNQLRLLAYYRVSIDRQGQCVLGLDAQRLRIQQMAADRGVVAVAKLDRLARDAEHVLRLSREAEANGLAGFLFCDLPEIVATTSARRLFLYVKASVAEFESRRISERTREAMAQARARDLAWAKAWRFRQRILDAARFRGAV
jgi:DNA invertase Pin-like site-specific DNA recombinase